MRIKKKIEKKKANIVFICVLDKNNVMQAKQHSFVQHVSGIFQVGQPFQKVIGDWLSDSVMGGKKAFDSALALHEKVLIDPPPHSNGVFHST